MQINFVHQNQIPSFRLWWEVGIQKSGNQKIGQINQELKSGRYQSRLVLNLEIQTEEKRDPEDGNKIQLSQKILLVKQERVNET